MTNDIAVRVHKDSVVQDSIYGRRVRGLDVFLTVIIYTCAGFSILLLAGIMGYVFVRGIPHVTWAFLSTASSATKGTFGILGNIINTLYIVIITLLIATPLGIGSAVYLNEYAKPGKVVRLIEFTTETLSGIPSIIFGLFGMVFFGNALGLGYSILTGALTLTIMILPLIIGATKWYMIRTILLPSAMPGILTGIILAIGRIVGESAALLFTAGSGYYLPKNLFSKIFESGGTLTIQLYLFMQKAKYNEAFGVAVVLLVIVLGINGLAKYMSHRFNVEAGA